MSIVDAPIKSMTTTEHGEIKGQTSLLNEMTLPVRMPRVVEIPKGFQQKLTQRLEEQPCNHDLRQTMVTLNQLGLDVFHSYPVLTHFENHGCFCDCEVLMNYDFSQEE